MKKVYEAPKVEKMAFDYSDVVVASKAQCYDIVNKTFVHVTDGPACESDTISTTLGSVGN